MHCLLLSHHICARRLWLAAVFVATDLILTRPHDTFRTCSWRPETGILTHNTTFSSPCPDPMLSPLFTAHERWFYLSRMCLVPHLLPVCCLCRTVFSPNLLWRTTFRLITSEAQIVNLNWIVTVFLIVSNQGPFITVHQRAENARSAFLTQTRASFTHTHTHTHAR